MAKGKKELIKTYAFDTCRYSYFAPLALMPTHVDESYLDALLGPSILFLGCFILLEIHKTGSFDKVGYFHEWQRFARQIVPQLVGLGCEAVTGTEGYDWRSDEHQRVLC